MEQNELKENTNVARKDSNDINKKLIQNSTPSSYRLNFSEIYKFTRDQSNSKELAPENEFFSSLCLMSSKIDQSNKINILTLLSFFNFKRNNYDSVYHIAKKIEKYSSYKTGIEPFIYIRTFYRAGVLLNEQGDYFNSLYFCNLAYKFVDKSGKINEESKRLLNEASDKANINYQKYVLEKEKLFKKLEIDEIKEIQMKINNIINKKDIINNDENTDANKNNTYVYIINSKWVRKCKLFIDNLIIYKQFDQKISVEDESKKQKDENITSSESKETTINDSSEQCSTNNKNESKLEKDENEEPSNKENKNNNENQEGKKPDNHKLELQDFLAISLNKSNIYKYYFGLIDKKHKHADILNTIGIFPGTINNFPILNYKEYLNDPDLENCYQDNIYLNKNIKEDDDYYLVSEETFNLLKNYFGVSQTIKRKKDEFDLKRIKCFIIYDRIINKKNYNLIKVHNLQISKNITINEFKEKIFRCVNHTCEENEKTYDENVQEKIEKNDAGTNKKSSRKESINSENNEKKDNLKEKEEVKKDTNKDNINENNKDNGAFTMKIFTLHKKYSENLVFLGLCLFKDKEKFIKSFHLPCEELIIDNNNAPSDNTQTKEPIDKQNSEIISQQNNNNEIQGNQNKFFGLNFDVENSILLIEITDCNNNNNKKLKDKNTSFIIPKDNLCNVCKKPLDPSTKIICDKCSCNEYCSKTCLLNDVYDQKIHSLTDEYITEAFNLEKLLSTPLNSILISSDNNNHGLNGLANLGFTCYMNSAIQCLSNTEDLTKYFLLKNYSQEINYANRLGSSGSLVESYYKLISNIWEGKHRVINPKEFREEFAKKTKRFYSYRQEDSQEMLIIFLDNLHEDLNRISNKPYVEMKERQSCESDKVASERWWINHKKREDSVIVDLFYGQFKSTISCPECKNSIITYDPFMFLSLPLPIERIKVNFKFFYKASGNEIIESTNSKDYNKKDKWSDSQNNNIFTYKMMEYVGNKNSVLKDIKVMCVNFLKAKDKLLFYENNKYLENTKETQSSKDTLDKKENKEKEENKENTLDGKSDTNSLPKKDYTDWDIEAVVFNNEKSIITIVNQNDDYIYKYFIKNEIEFCIYENNSYNTIPIYIYPIILKEERKFLGLATSQNITLLSYPIPIYIAKRETVGDLYTKILEVLIPSLDQKLIKNKTKGLIQPYIFHNNPQTARNMFMIHSEPICEFCNNSKPYQNCCPLYNNQITNKTQIYELFLKLSNNRPLVIYVTSNYFIKNKRFINNMTFPFDFYLKNDTQENVSKIIDNDTKTIYDCLKLFNLKEQLDNDDWYCSICKKHQRAFKQIDIYKAPIYLIFQLKRFKVRSNSNSSNGNSNRKNNLFIEYPVNGLDLQNYIIGDDKENCVYDLYGVVEHYGDLNQGHYIALCKNDDKWYKFNDELVEEVNKGIINENAYLLFYKRRNGGDGLEINNN